MTQGRRSFKVGPWHYCARSGKKSHISEMKWEQGLLIRNDEADTMILGQRDVMVARAIENPGTEMQPDQKLQQPNVADVEDILI